MFMAPWTGPFAPRFFGHTCPVDLAVSEMESEEFRTTAPPVETRSGWYRDSLARHQASPDGRSEIRGISVSEELATHRGSQTVGAHEQITARDGPVTQGDLYVGSVFAEASHFTSKTQPFGAEGLRERGLQVGAVNKADAMAVTHVGRAHRHLNEPSPMPIAERYI